MSAKHTPGPWVVHDDGEMVCQPVRSGCINVATVMSGHIEYKANARLIAAAPDLLDCCIGAVEELEVVQEVDGVAESTSVLLDKLRATIAKATGEG